MKSLTKSEKREKARRSTCGSLERKVTLVTTDPEVQKILKRMRGSAGDVGVHNLQVHFVRPGKAVYEVAVMQLEGDEYPDDPNKIKVKCLAVSNQQVTAESVGGVVKINIPELNHYQRDNIFFPIGKYFVVVTASTTSEQEQWLTSFDVDEEMSKVWTNNVIYFSLKREHQKLEEERKRWAKEKIEFQKDKELFALGLQQLGEELKTLRAATHNGSFLTSMVNGNGHHKGMAMIPRALPERVEQSDTAGDESSRRNIPSETHIVGESVHNGMPPATAPSFNLVEEGISSERKVEENTPAPQTKSKWRGWFAKA